MVGRVAKVPPLGQLSADSDPGHQLPPQQAVRAAAAIRVRAARRRGEAEEEELKECCIVVPVFLDCWLSVTHAAGIRPGP